VNDPPSTPADLNPAADLVAENAPNGTLVGITAFSTDVDGPPVSYSLTDNAGGRFAINSTTGVVTVANGSLLDYETTPSHQIIVRATDGTLSSTQTFTIAVTNVVGSTINGSASADLIDATHTPSGQALPTQEEDLINGLAGNDTLSGLGGNDTLDVGAGN